MPKFAANLTMLFTELPFLERFAAASKANFKAVEFLFPYDFLLEDIQQRLEVNGLKLVLHNFPAGDWAAGERGIACWPDREEEFRAGVATAIRYAKGLGVHYDPKRVQTLRPQCPEAPQGQAKWADSP